MKIIEEEAPEIFDSKNQPGYFLCSDAENTGYETPTRLFKYRQLSNESVTGRNLLLTQMLRNKPTMKPEVLNEEPFILPKREF